MKKNGFVFIETIVAVVILASTLLLLYTSFSKILQQEKTRVHYDNISYIYRTWYLKNAFNNLNIMSPLKEVQDDKYFVTIGLNYDELFIGYNKEKNLIASLLNDFDVNQILLVRETKLNELKRCTNNSSNANCVELYQNVSNEMVRYIKTMFVDVSGSHVLIAEFVSCDQNGKNCSNYYSWVSV